MTQDRKSFLKLIGISSLSLLISYLGFKKYQKTKTIQVPGKISGGNFNAGHRLLKEINQSPTKEVSIDTVIVGGGIAGLSAGWFFNKKNYSDFILFELDSDVGGNSKSGENTISKYPFGAHYVPLPGTEAKYVREFFEDIGIITGYQNKLPVYNEYYLCADPHERLYFKGNWQENLIHVRGIQPEEKKQYNEFFSLIDMLKNKKGNDGKYAFVIPMEFSSRDPEFLKLDRISMFEFMKSMGWNSTHLNWYVDYCCRDDFGTPMKEVSAWAGLHYFSSRASRAFNADPQTVLTWPEGNGFLVNKMKEILKTKIQTESLVYHIEVDNQKQYQIDIFNSKYNSFVRYKANHLIYAAPRFTAKHIIKDFNESLTLDSRRAPWMVANITLKQKPRGNGVTLAWDNVSFYSRSLGYIVANHQDLTTHRNECVITYYLPLDEQDPQSARKMAQERTYEEWLSIILPDLENIHPGIIQDLLYIDLWIWGHGMVSPGINFLWSKNRRKLLQNFQGIEFAHSEMSGISIFEEAQYRGCEAAKKILRKV